LIYAEILFIVSNLGALCASITVADTGKPLPDEHDQGNWKFIRTLIYNSH
jgi:hypothetical protein